jgi:hypothetical protein
MERHGGLIYCYKRPYLFNPSQANTPWKCRIILKSSYGVLTAIRQCRIVQEVIAEIVSLSGYESQVSALMDEEERAAMEFFIACAPEVHPVIAGAGGFRKARWGSTRQR